MKSSYDKQNVPCMVNKSQDTEVHIYHSNAIVGTSNNALRSEEQVVVATSDVIFKIIWLYVLIFTQYYVSIDCYF